MGGKLRSACGARPDAEHRPTRQSQISDSRLAYVGADRLDIWSYGSACRSCSVRLSAGAAERLPAAHLHGSGPDPRRKPFDRAGNQADYYQAAFRWNALVVHLPALGRARGPTSPAAGLKPVRGTAGVCSQVCLPNRKPASTCCAPRVEADCKVGRPSGPLFPAR